MDRAATERPCPAEAPAPPWILETQRSTAFSGSWEPTAAPWRGACLVPGYAAGSEDPPPLQGFDARQEPAGPGAVLAASPERLRGLIAEEGDPQYEAVVDETTDEEGWIYATACARFAVPRLGGRAAPRLGDRRRRRWWRRRGAADAPLTSTASMRSWAPPDASVNEHTRAQNSALEALALVLGRRRLSGLPLDPVAHMRRAWKDSSRFIESAGRLPRWSQPEALGALCMAAVYARAAYALVGRMGMFDSVSGGAWVFSLQKARYDMSEDVDIASNTTAFLDMVQLRVEDFVCAQWRTAGPFCPVYAVVRDRDLRWIVVSVRGTLSTKDVLTDVAANAVPFLEGHAHEGFVDTADRLLAQLRDVLREELAAHPGYRLVLCGHSMGGAVAALAAARLHAEEPWAAGVVAYTIGTPAALSLNLGRRLRDEGVVYTVVNDLDWSPRMSLTNAHELVDDIVDLGVMRSLLRNATGGEPVQAAVESPEVEQLPPGRILQIVSPRPGLVAEAACEGASPSQVRLLEAVPEDYRHTMQVWPDIDAHIPMGYIRNLLQGFSQCLAADSASRLASAESGSPVRPGPAPPTAATDFFPEVRRDDLLGEGGGAVVSQFRSASMSALAALNRVALCQQPWQGACDRLPAWPDAARRTVAEHLGVAHAPPL